MQPIFVLFLSWLNLLVTSSYIQDFILYSAVIAMVGFVINRVIL